MNIKLTRQLNQARRGFYRRRSLELRNLRDLMQQIHVSNLSIFQVERNFPIQRRKNALGARSRREMGIRVCRKQPVQRLLRR